MFPVSLTDFSSVGFQLLVQCSAFFFHLTYSFLEVHFTNELFKVHFINIYFMSLLNILNLSSSFLNTCNVVIIEILMSLSKNAIICDISEFVSIYYCLSLL